MPPLEPAYREIQLTQGQVTRVSERIYTEYAQLSWYALKRACGGFYAVRKATISRKAHYHLHASPNSWSCFFERRSHRRSYQLGDVE